MGPEGSAPPSWEGGRWVMSGFPRVQMRWRLGEAPRAVPVGEVATRPPALGPGDPGWQRALRSLGFRL